MRENPYRAHSWAAEVFDMIPDEPFVLRDFRDAVRAVKPWISYAVIRDTVKKEAKAGRLQRTGRGRYQRPGGES